MRRLLVVLLLLVEFPAFAHAATIDRVRAAGLLHCGGVPRPGLASTTGDGEMTGLEVDLCRAIAAAVLGDGAKIDFHPYAIGKDFERLRRGDDAVAFLTGSELLANSLLDAVVPGPAVFYQTNGVMVLTSSRAEHLDDLAGTMICSEAGTGPQRTLLAYFRSHGLAISFSPWQEEEEMLDAFEVGRCPAVAMETTDLAAQRADGEARGHPIRILPEPLSASPIMAVSGQDDARWAAIVAWTMNSLMQPAAIAEAMPIPGAGLGLAPGWQVRARAAGDYAAITARSLGAHSPLQLPAALDGPWSDGGLICPPRAE